MVLSAEIGNAKRRGEDVTLLLSFWVLFERYRGSSASYANATAVVAALRLVVVINEFYSVWRALFIAIQNGCVMSTVTFNRSQPLL
jgi:hypothetical protein